jgi:hypothetical protein
VASGGPGLVKTSGYTITVADILGGNKFLYNSASPGTFTLPTSSLVDGMVVNVAQIGAGALTVSGGTIVGTTVTTAQYQGLSFVYVASGTTWYSIAPNVTAPGLAIVTPTSIANSGGSSSASGGAVTFTGVTSISLNGVFSSAYDNYVIKYALTGASGNANLTMRLRVAGTDATGASDYTRQAFVGVGSGSAISTQTGSSWTYSGIAGSPSTVNTVEVFSPFLAVKTNATSRSMSFDGAGGSWQSAADGFNHSQTSSYDGCTLITSAGSVSGVVRVYGYKNS